MVVSKSFTFNSAFMNHFKKQILSFTLIFLSVCALAQQQVDFDFEPEPTTNTNNSCAASLKVCASMDQRFEFRRGKKSCEIESFFFRFDFANDNTNAINLVLSNSGADYEWYGPFADFNLDACAQIESYLAQSTAGSLQLNSSVFLNAEQGSYVLKVIPSNCSGTITLKKAKDLRLLCDNNVPCTECVTSFSPTPGKYLVSAWVSETGNGPSVTTFTNTAINVSFPGSTQTAMLTPKGSIIDGWQRIEEVIEVPLNATGIDIQLTVFSGIGYFDDIRFYPVDGSMKSFVYDPETLRLMAELDERNYATLYEYDEEGVLIRVKKETEKGIMTLKENRNNIKKQ
tara:strand:- start:1654 stop:2679 length:1026 start_codon:yes stop_codon:yes gene_type:complete